MEILQQKAEPYVTEYGENQIAGSGPLWNSIVRSGTEMSPGVGDLLGAEDLQTAAQNNDWGGIGLGMLAAIPGIPAIGRGVRGEARAARGVGGAGADAMENAGYRVERSQDLAPTDTPESLRAQGYEIDPATNTWARTVATEAPPVDYPIRAFHGSPHSFDRFSLDKIGTGEGAQAYGHGLYFAENENVARSYRDALSAVNFDRMIYADTPINDLPPELARKLKYHFGGTTSIDDAVQMHRDSAARYLREAEGDTSNPLYLEELNALKFVEDAAQRLKLPSGSMYEVGINADPSTFLDWDRPLSEQPAIAERLGVDPTINARRAAEIRASVADDMRMSGRSEPDSIDLDRIRLAEEMDALDATGNASSYAPRSQEQLEAMLARGISGIRYLDGSSRSAIPPTIKDGPSGLEVYWGNDPTPVGTYPTRQEAEEAARQLDTRSRNYVVFNDELVKILRKYGISGLSTTVGASALAEELDRRGQTQEF